MGTRGLTKVIHKGETKVAQYGQWDHYPSGQGITALNFLKSLDENHFIQQLEKCKFVDDEKNKEVEEFLRNIGASGGWMTSEQSKIYNNRYPNFSRDHGAEILSVIDGSSDDVIWLFDSSSFEVDGLFCEGVYTVNLDNKTFTVNWNKIHVFDLSNLPSEEDFIKICEADDEEDNI